MAYQQKDNSGSLFKNDRKQKETHPDYKGTVMINGKEMWVSAWVKTAQSGQNQGSKFFSLSFQDKEMQNVRASDFNPNNSFAPDDGSTPPEDDTLAPWER